MNMQCRWFREDDPISLDRKYTKKGQEVSIWGQL